MRTHGQTTTGISERAYRQTASQLIIEAIKRIDSKLPYSLLDREEILTRALWSISTKSYVVAGSRPVGKNIKVSIRADIHYADNSLLSTIITEMNSAPSHKSLTVQEFAEKFVLGVISLEEPYDSIAVNCTLKNVPCWVDISDEDVVRLCPHKTLTSQNLCLRCRTRRVTTAGLFDEPKDLVNESEVGSTHPDEISHVEAQLIKVESEILQPKRSPLLTLLHRLIAGVR